MSLVSRAPFRQQLADYTTYVGVGEPAPDDTLPGDIVLMHGKHLFSKIIRFGQGLRYRGDERPFARWNHVAVVSGRRGQLVEALSSGVRHSTLADHLDEEYVVVNITASDESRLHAVEYLRWVADLGTRYGWGLIASIGLGLLTGGRLSVNLDGSEICSTLAAESLKCHGYRFNREHVMPADLAHYFGVWVT